MKVVKIADVTIYIHEDACDAEMKTAVQEVADIIFDIYKRKNEEHLEAAKNIPRNNGGLFSAENGKFDA